MTTVREFAEKDIPEVVELFARVSPEHGWRRPEDCAEYFREMLFANPWRDLDLPSWVAAHRGRLVGFYAVMPRPMRLRGRPLRAAIGCQISVLPEFRTSLATLQLLQACLRGPQDLTLADAAHERSRRLWVGLGGAAPALYSLNWILPLRPAQCLLSQLEARGRLSRGVRSLARPLAVLADRWLLPSALPSAIAPAAVEDTELDVADMLAEWEQAAGGIALRPDYARGALEWLLQQLGRRDGLGRLRGRAVREGRRMAGWYLYFVRPGGIGEVVQLVARGDRYGAVLGRLREDAARQGVAGLRGRLDPRRLEEHAQSGCWFRREGRCTLVHSREREVLEAFRQADAIVGRMDGEWWLRFVGD